MLFPTVYLSGCLVLARPKMRLTVNCTDAIYMDSVFFAVCCLCVFVVLLVGLMLVTRRTVWVGRHLYRFVVTLGF